MKSAVILLLMAAMLSPTLTDAAGHPLNLQCVGPKLVEQGYDVTFQCTFDPPQHGEYTLQWKANIGVYEHKNENIKETVVLAEMRSDEIEPSLYYINNRTSYYLKTGYHDNKFIMSKQSLSGGKSSLTIFNAGAANDRDHICAIVDGQNRTIDSELIEMRVYKKPSSVYLLEGKYEEVPNREVEGGDPITMRHEICLINDTYPPPKSVELVKSSGTVVTTNPYGVRNKHFNNPDHTTNYTFNFFFVPDVAQHNDRYYCRMKMGVDLGSDTFITSANSTNPIMVDHSTNFTRLTISPESVLEGNDVEIRCECDGYPIYDFNIYNLDSGEVIASSSDQLTSSLRVSVKATRDMAGEYVCVANNVKDSKTLTVRWYKSIVVKNNGDVVAGNDVIVNEGDNVTLSCAQVASSTPELEWKYYINHLAEVKPEISGKEVIIQNVTLEQAGTYVCESSVNVKKEINLRVEVPCDPQMAVTVNETGNGQYTLNVTCSDVHHNEQCICDITTAWYWNKPTVINSAGSLSWIYEGLPYIHSNPQARSNSVPKIQACSLSEDRLKIIAKTLYKEHKMFSCLVKNEVSKKGSIVAARAENAGYIGLSSGAMAAIVLAVLAFIGTVCFVYRNAISGFASRLVNRGNYSVADRIVYRDDAMIKEEV